MKRFNRNLWKCFTVKFNFHLIKNKRQLDSWLRSHSNSCTVRVLKHWNIATNNPKKISVNLCQYVALSYEFHHLYGTFQMSSRSHNILVYSFSTGIFFADTNYEKIDLQKCNFLQAKKHGFFIIERLMKERKEERHWGEEISKCLKEIVDSVWFLREMTFPWFERKIRNSRAYCYFCISKAYTR